MKSGDFANSVRPSSGSLLHRWMQRRAVNFDEFDCGIRVVDGHVEGEGRRLRYRRSAVDPLFDGVTTLHHGPKVVLRIRFSGERVTPTGLSVSPHHVVWSGVEVVSGAAVEVAADPAEADRLHVPA